MFPHRNHRNKRCRRRSLSSSSAIHEYWDLRVREHFDRLAAEDNRRDTATPVRSHHDQITPSGGSGIDDCLIDMFVFDLEYVAGDTGGLCCVGNIAEDFCGMSLRMFLILDRRVFELARCD